MPKSTPKAIFIGRKDIGQALSKLRTDWEFSEPVESIDALWEGLSNETIDKNTQVILILDTLFDPQGADTAFEKLVAAMSPWCMFCIVEYTQGNREAIRERVEYESYGSGQAGDPLYFFIDPTKPNKSLDSALEEYAEKSQARDAVAILTGRELTQEPDLTEEQRARASAKSSLGDMEEDNPYLGQIVAITSSKGGSGKSTVSTTLAAYLAYSSEASAAKKLEERPLKVVVLDLDVRDGQLGFLTGYSKPTIINLRLNGITDDVFSNTVIHSKKLHVDLLLAPKRPRNAEDTPPDFYIELLQYLRRNYDYVILDTSVNYLDPLLEKVAYPTADQIIFVTDIVVNSVFSMTRWITEVTNDANQGGMGINKNKVGIVVNKALADVNMSSEKIQRSALGLSIITAIPSNPKLVAHAANMQMIELLLQHSGIRASIRRLARAITGKKYNLSDDF